MSRTTKKPSCFWGDWWKKKPWKYCRGGYGGRRYKTHRKHLQRQFRQANRLALIHEREVPDQSPVNWWLIF